MRRLVLGETVMARVNTEFTCVKAGPVRRLALEAARQ